MLARFLITLFIALFFLYAPIELTRVIVAWGLYGKFIFEVVVMIWMTYLIGVLLIYKGLNWR